MRTLMIWMLLASPAMASSFEDGTLLFLENSSNIVECYTDSSYSHVAVILSDEHGEKWLYNAEPPRVRKYRLVDYFKEIGRMNEGTKSKVITSILCPKEPYTEEQVGKLRHFLEDQVGRGYSIKGYLRKVEGVGIHCSQMCAGAVEATGRQSFSSPNYCISPGKLRSLVSSTYKQHGNKLLVETKHEHRRTISGRWSNWWKSRGTLCSWSCWETLRFCW